MRRSLCVLLQTRGSTPVPQRQPSGIRGVEVACGEAADKQTSRLVCRTFEGRVLAARKHAYEARISLAASFGRLPEEWAAKGHHFGPASYAALVRLLGMLGCRRRAAALWRRGCDACAASGRHADAEFHVLHRALLRSASFAGGFEETLRESVPRLNEHRFLSRHMPASSRVLLADGGGFDGAVESLAPEHVACFYRDHLPAFREALREAPPPPQPSQKKQAARHPAATPQRPPSSARDHLAEALLSGPAPPLKAAPSALPPPKPVRSLLAAVSACPCLDSALQLLNYLAVSRRDLLARRAAATSGQRVTAFVAALPLGLLPVHITMRQPEVYDALCRACLRDATRGRDPQVLRDTRRLLGAAAHYDVDLSAYFYAVLLRCYSRLRPASPDVVARPALPLARQAWEAMALAGHLPAVHHYAAYMWVHARDAAVHGPNGLRDESETGGVLASLRRLWRRVERDGFGDDRRLLRCGVVVSHHAGCSDAVARYLGKLEQHGMHLDRQTSQLLGSSKHASLLNIANCHTEELRQVKAPVPLCRS